MNLSKEQIETLIKVGEAGDNDLGLRTIESSKNSLCNRLIEGKVLIDRWENITTKILFNTEHDKFVDEQLSKNEYYHNDGKKFNIWGADIIFSDHVPSNKILMLSNEDRIEELMDPVIDEDDDDFDSKIDNGRAIAVIPMVNT